MSTRSTFEWIGDHLRPLLVAMSVITIAAVPFATAHMDAEEPSFDPTGELYDIRDDAECITNLADDLEYEARKQELAAQLTAELEAQGDPRMFGNGAVFEEEYPVHQERLLDYYEKAMKGEGEPLGWINQSDIERIPEER